jgi:nitroreductase
MDAYRAIVDKRDQRVFLPKAIPEEALRRILQAARMTGSSKNREPNRLIVVTGREGVTALGALGEWGKWLAHAAVVVVIAQVEPHEFDAGRCAQNMMVAAWAEGIASCPAHLPEPEVARLLGIPKELHVNRVIGFGYADPARAQTPRLVARRRKPLEELVHRERW